MIPAISNIAWAPECHLEAMKLLADLGVGGLEIAPSVFFSTAPDPFKPPQSLVEHMCKTAADAGLQLVSMQSLFFGTDGAFLFGDADERQVFELQMGRSIALAERLNIPNLVFGAPQNRRAPAHMTHDEAEDRALAIFTRLGDRAARAGSVIAFEHCPKEYGTNFLNGFQDVYAFIRKAAHPALAINLDIGALEISGEKLPASGVEHVHHVHISEPCLGPAPGSISRAIDVLGWLEQTRYDGAVSIEMKPHPAGLDGVAYCLESLAEAWSKLGLGGSFGAVDDGS